MRRLTLVVLLTLAPSLALAACTQEHEPAADPSPPVAGATASTTAAIAIPGAFPLTDGMPSDVADGISVSAQSVGMRALDFCGRKPLRGLNPTDRLAAEASGNEYASTRDLMLFAEDGPSAAVLEDIREAASACPTDPLGPGSELLTEVRDSSFGSDAVTVVHTFAQDGEVGVGAEIIEVVLVDRALLVTSTYAEFHPATDLDEGIAEEADRLAATVEAMSVFRNEPAAPGV